MQHTNIVWRWPRYQYPDFPSSKVTLALLDAEFSSLMMRPIRALYRYECESTDEHRETVATWSKRIGPYCLIHTEGASSPPSKNLLDDEVQPIIDTAKQRGIAPVLLDWGKTPHRLIQRGCIAPYELWEWRNETDAGLIKELIANAVCMCAIDSGPGHAAACTNTPTVMVWTGYHPIHNFDLATNITHVVQEGWQLHPAAQTVFDRDYPHVIYPVGKLTDAIADVVCPLICRGTTCSTPPDVFCSHHKV